jgi:predicted aconitase
VLGARTNRYGDFLDIACAISGRAPDYGLHRDDNRRATVVFDVSQVDPRFMKSGVAWPVLGNLYGRLIGDAVGVMTGVAFRPWEDLLKAFGAAAASSGSVGLFHVAGTTPEAPDERSARRDVPPSERITVTNDMVRDAQSRLSTADRVDRIDAVAVGSPHLSLEEFDTLRRFLNGRRVAVPIYACTGRHVLHVLERDDHRRELEALGVIIVADTCIVVTPILPAKPGAILMTNSGKFAHYAPANTGYSVLYGSMSDCVESAVCGRPIFEVAAW